jgi:uncharacterized protein
VFAILSPAKKLNLEAAVDGLVCTRPVLLDEADRLATTCRNLSAENLKDLMRLSDALATLNRDRFRAYERGSEGVVGTPAAVTFAGDTYVGLGANDWSLDDHIFAQKNVGILSGLYGLLRPLDAIQPYRLEMGTRLKTRRGNDLYQFWGERISRRIDQVLAGHAHPVVINLASTEYFRAVDLKSLQPRVITPVFKEVRDGQAKVISFMAKRARGAMAGFLVRQRLTDPEALKGFGWEGYRFDPGASQDARWVFTRPR